MTTKDSGGPPVRGTAAAETKSSIHEAGPRDSSSADRLTTPITAGDGQVPAVAPLPGELAAHVRQLVTRLTGGAAPPSVATPAYWIAAPPVRTAALLQLAGAWIVEHWSELDPDVLKAAAVAGSVELKRQRDLVRRRKDAIGAALRRGDAARAYALTVHHASDRWAKEMA